MKSKPMLFSAPMVRALLEGRKTQTRRIFKGTSEHKGPYNPSYLEMYQKSSGWGTIAPHPVGSEIWVRETWAEFPSDGDWIYRADHPEKLAGQLKWRPSIFMPRCASRITLKVTDVRVQRLQDISKEDAKAEGIRDDGAAYLDYMSGDYHFSWAVSSYQSLWESINGPGSWDANPYVWAYTFEVKK